MVARCATDRRRDHGRAQGVERAGLSAPRPVAGSAWTPRSRAPHFPGKRTDHVLRVVAPRTAHAAGDEVGGGPFPTHVTYRFDATPTDTTTASIRASAAA